MPNAVFDNDTFRISTEAYTDESGKRIEADQVPVVVRGRDYDFSGRGLVIRWNQLDRKLQLLEVAHGESLTVKNLDALSKPKLRTPRLRAPARGRRCDAMRRRRTRAWCSRRRIRRRKPRPR